MSLMALMATSVSAYAVSSTSLASGASGRACSRNSTPVITGIRWSEAISATWRSRKANSDRTLMASAPDRAGTTWNSAPYWRRRSRVMAWETAASSSTVRIAGLATPPLSDLAVVGADEGDHHHAGFVERVPPRVASAVLHDGVAGAELHRGAVVEFEHDPARHHELVVDGRGGVHAGRVGLQVGSHAGEHCFELGQCRRHVDLPRAGRRCRWQREQAEAEAADGREVLLVRRRRTGVGKRRGLV